MLVTLWACIGGEPTSAPISSICSPSASAGASCFRKSGPVFVFSEQPRGRYCLRLGRHFPQPLNHALRKCSAVQVSATIIWHSLLIKPVFRLLYFGGPPQPRSLYNHNTGSIARRTSHDTHAFFFLSSSSSSPSVLAQEHLGRLEGKNQIGAGGKD